MKIYLKIIIKPSLKNGITFQNHWFKLCFDCIRDSLKEVIRRNAYIHYCNKINLWIIYLLNDNNLKFNKFKSTIMPGYCKLYAIYEFNTFSGKFMLKMEVLEYIVKAIFLTWKR